MRYYYSMPKNNCKFQNFALVEINFQPGLIRFIGDEPKFYRDIKFPIEHTIELIYEHNVIETYSALTDTNETEQFFSQLKEENLGEFSVALDNIEDKDVKSFILFGVKFRLTSLAYDIERFIWDDVMRVLTTVNKNE